MLGLKLIQFSKRDPWFQLEIGLYLATSVACWPRVTSYLVDGLVAEKSAISVMGSTGRDQVSDTSNALTLTINKTFLVV